MLDQRPVCNTEIPAKIDLPGHYDHVQVLQAIQKHLRAEYPLAIIRVEPSDHDGYDATWHVYRDGQSHAMEEPA